MCGAIDLWRPCLFTMSSWSLWQLRGSLHWVRTGTGPVWSVRSAARPWHQAHMQRWDTWDDIPLTSLPSCDTWARMHGKLDIYRRPDIYPKVESPPQPREILGLLGFMQGYSATLNPILLQRNLPRSWHHCNTRFEPGSPAWEASHLPVSYNFLG